MSIIIKVWMNYNYDLLLKYIIIGDSSNSFSSADTGKSCLLNRFITDKYQQNTEPTLGAQFAHKIVQLDEMTVKIMIWDTAGQQTYQSLVKCYYRNCIVVIVTYDATKRTSFLNVPKWIQIIKENSHEHVRVVLVANKIDLQENITVPNQEAIQLANQEGIMFFSASAAEGTNVESVFVQPALRIISDLSTRKLNLSSDMDIGVKFSNREIVAAPTTILIDIGADKDGTCKC